MSGDEIVSEVPCAMAGNMAFGTSPGFNIPFLPFLPHAGPHLQNGGDGFHLPFKGF